MNPLHRVMAHGRSVRAHGYSDPIAGPSPMNRRQRETVTRFSVVMQRRSECAPGFSGPMRLRTERVTHSSIVI